LGIPAIETLGGGSEPKGRKKEKLPKKRKMKTDVETFGERETNDLYGGIPQTKLFLK